jgi:hypothetical protein
MISTRSHNFPIKNRYLEKHALIIGSSAPHETNFEAIYEARTDPNITFATTKTNKLYSSKHYGPKLN